jgi:hypothetical protein
MHTVSFAKKALNISIHNLHPSLELSSPIYCNNGTTCHVSSSQQIDACNTTVTCFGIDSEETLKSALLYKLQRKYATRTGN